VIDPAEVRAQGDSPLVEFVNLSRSFHLSSSLLPRLLAPQARSVVHAVDDVSFSIERTKTFSLVGESGCGKSTLARCAVGVYQPSSGRVLFEGEELGAASAGSAGRHVRRRVQMIFQDPFSSLNPRWRIGDIVAEPIRAYALLNNRREIAERVSELLVQVGLSGADATKYPHQLSGGQRQRVSIARALSSNPDFLICDEPTSALDVSVQAQILNLMRDLQHQLGLTYLFISHNLAVVYHMSDRVGVMYLGRMVEMTDAETLFTQPMHPYTRMLMQAIPKLKGAAPRRRPVGEIPNPTNPPPGCHFHPRCGLANDRCRTVQPELRTFGGTEVACHAVEEGRLPAFEP